MGYQYVLQYDSDSFVVKPASVNLVHLLRSKNIWLANYPYFFDEVKDEEHVFICLSSPTRSSSAVTAVQVLGYMIGLPELTAFWLKTRNKCVLLLIWYMPLI